MEFALADLLVAGGSIRRGRLEAITESGYLLVEAEGETSVCCWLETGAGRPVELGPGDEVIVLVTADPDGMPCVLGRVGLYPGPADRPPAPADESADRLIVAAEEEVTIHCGQSSITLRRDGKILIQGVDVVSKAARTQRIKGGSVQIN
jgi:hypothetical protein